MTKTSPLAIKNVSDVSLYRISNICMYYTMVFYIRFLDYTYISYEGMRRNKTNFVKYKQERGYIY